MAASLASHALEAGLTRRDGVLVGRVGKDAARPRQAPSPRDAVVLARLPYNSEHDSEELIASSSDMQESATTALRCFTDSGAEMGLAERSTAA